MGTSTPPTDPDALAVLHALLRDGLSPEDAYNALEGLRNMTGRNVEARFNAVEARFDALESKIDTLRTMITWGLAALGVLVAALRLFG